MTPTMQIIKTTFLLILMKINYILCLKIFQVKKRNAAKKTQNPSFGFKVFHHSSDNISNGTGLIDTLPKTFRKEKISYP